MGLVDQAITEELIFVVDLKALGALAGQVHAGSRPAQIKLGGTGGLLAHALDTAAHTAYLKGQVRFVLFDDLGGFGELGRQLMGLGQYVSSIAVKNSEVFKVSGLGLLAGLDGFVGHVFLQ